MEALAGGLNMRKMLEQAVCNELCSMLDPGKEPYHPKKNSPTASKVVPKESIPHTRTCKMGCKKAILEMPTVDDIQGSMVRSCCTLAILRPCYCSW